MKHETAKELMGTMQDISAKLNASVKSVMDNEDQEQFKQYRRIAGNLMGIIYSDVIRPIYQEYPDLTPVGLRPEDKVAPSK